MNSGDSQIDSRGLMADLSRMSWLLEMPTALSVTPVDTANQASVSVKKETVKNGNKRHPVIARKV